MIKKEKKELLVDPKKFLKSSRIDLIPKLLYVKNKEEINADYFIRLYLEHIRAFNSFNENHKRTKEDFIKDFDKVIDSIKNDGFKKEMGSIPATENFTAIDGAHRISSSIFFDKKIFVETGEGEGPSYNYNYFKKRGLPEHFLEEIIYNYFDIKKKGLYACIFWGSSLEKLNEKEINKELVEKNITAVYSKDVSLTEIGKKNLVISCYENEPWMNDKKNDFSGAIRKVAPCFKNSNKIKFYLLESDSHQNIINFKKNIRTKLKMENHSLHTSDTYEETRNLCDILLNKNSLFFINHTKNMILSNLLNKKELKEKFNFAITSSYILEMFGIRKAEDIDYIDDKKGEIKGMGSHNEYLSLEERKDFIYDPNNYFRFKGIKFLTLENVHKFKKSRGENKDKRDVFLIEKFLENNKKSNYKEKIIVMQIKAISLALKAIKKIPQSTRDNFKNNKITMGIYKKLFC